MLMLCGGAVLVLGAVVPAQAAQALEPAVGVMLVALGADALYRLRRERIHFHAHRHADGVARFHVHSHRGEGAPHDPARHEHVHLRGFPARALLIGMVHGMAGSAALVLLGLEALRSPAWGFVYIATFGLGSILGMAALSAAIAVPLAADVASPDPRARRPLGGGRPGDPGARVLHRLPHRNRHRPGRVGPALERTGDIGIGGRASFSHFAPAPTRATLRGRARARPARAASARRDTRSQSPAAGSRS